MALMTAKEYIDSLRKLNTRVYMFGEKLDNWVDHPMIRPSINCGNRGTSCPDQLAQALKAYKASHQA